MSDSDRPRIRELGITPGIFEPGPRNAITDVSGVAVGHKTLIEGESVRTGVTAVVPHGGDLFREKTPAAVHTANGYGKAAGFLQVRELGTLETPIVLTNTLSVGRAVEAVVEWTVARDGHADIQSVNAVVGETNDGYLNDIRGLHVSKAHVVAAIESADGGPVREGTVGAGTGTTALGWKGGIGTASRRLPEGLGGYTVGALVQTNYGGVLTIDGVKVGEALGRYDFADAVGSDASDGGTPTSPADGGTDGGTPTSPADGGTPTSPASDGGSDGGTPTSPASGRGTPTSSKGTRAGTPTTSPDSSAQAGTATTLAAEAQAGGAGTRTSRLTGADDGSCMMVIATDAPLGARNLERMARRAPLGLARTGSYMSNGSGDFAIAFSTANIGAHAEVDRAEVERLANRAMSPLFLATVEAVEEAVYNSLTKATTVRGRDDHVREAIDIDKLKALLHSRDAGG